MLQKINKKYLINIAIIDLLKIYNSILYIINNWLMFQIICKNNLGKQKQTWPTKNKERIKEIIAKPAMKTKKK